MNQEYRHAPSVAYPASIRLTLLLFLVKLSTFEVIVIGPL
jgi:hypothetical protein